MIRKLPPLERPEDFPGQTRVVWAREPHRVALAAVLGALWPPLIITLPMWRPRNWVPGLEMDWRLLVLLIGLLAVPGGLWLLDKERRRTGRPATRLGVIWRFMFYGGLLAAALGALFALVQSVLQWLNASNVGEAVGGSETSLLIYVRGLHRLPAPAGSARPPRPDGRTRAGLTAGSIDVTENLVSIAAR